MSLQVPFIKAGTIVVAEMDRIVNFVGYKKVSLTEGLDITQKADMRAYMSLVTNVLGSAEVSCKISLNLFLLPLLLRFPLL